MFDNEQCPQLIWQTNVQAGVLPSGEAVCSLPNTLVALCLNNAGMEHVRQTKALACFVPIFTSKAYIKALQGDTPPALGAGLDELLRHVGTLRKEGVEMIIDILKRLCEMGGMSIMLYTSSRSYRLHLAICKLSLECHPCSSDIDACVACCMATSAISVAMTYW